MHRREFLQTAAATGIAATLMTLSGAVALPRAKGLVVAGKKTIIDLDAPENLRLRRNGGSMKVSNPRDPRRPIIVTRISADEFSAISSRCSHLGCEVELPADGVILCKCHGSKFDVLGKVAKGPAKKNLQKYRTHLQASRLEIEENT